MFMAALVRSLFLSLIVSLSLLILLLLDKRQDDYANIERKKDHIHDLHELSRTSNNIIIRLFLPSFSNNRWPYVIAVCPPRLLGPETGESETYGMATWCIVPSLKYNILVTYNMTRDFL